MTSEGIDLNVLNELPEKLRQEIIKEYQLQPSIAKQKAVTETGLIFPSFYPQL